MRDSRPRMLKNSSNLYLELGVCEGFPVTDVRPFLCQQHGVLDGVIPEAVRILGTAFGVGVGQIGSELLLYQLADPLAILCVVSDHSKPDDVRHLVERVLVSL